MTDPHIPGPLGSGRAAAAAWENAEWCHAVCAGHGLAGTFAGRVWRSSRRTPRFYPDAVTLDPSATAEDALTGIDLSPGASVKDSFAALDLTDAGFRCLFTARWLWRQARPSATEAVEPPSRLPWRQVTDATALLVWQRTWARDDPEGDAAQGGANQRDANQGDATAGDDSEVADVLPLTLLDRDDVQFHAAYDGLEMVAGAVLHLGSAAVGISNVFDRTGDLARTWSNCARQASAVAGDRPLVGYERGEGLSAAVGAGFTEVGTLAVWLLDQVR
jgi:hypothetical protein